MKTGGTFVTSESLRQIDFNCNGTVYTNGYNLTLEEGVNISFKENAQIVMKKGKFLSGVLPSMLTNPAHSTLKGQSGNKWRGISFDSSKIDMGYITFQDVKQDSTYNWKYVLKVLNCDTVKVQYTYFKSDVVGCINIYYGSGAVTNPLININHDSLLVNSATNIPLKIFSNSSLSGSFTVNDNSIINTSFNGGTGIYIYGIHNALIKANTITYFNHGIFSDHSSPDLWANYISSGTAPGFSFAVYGLGTSVLDMSSNAGGYNTYNIDSGGCVKLDNSYFDMHNGNNLFRKADTLNHYYFEGYFQNSYSSTLEDGRTNCFSYNSWTPLDSAHVKYNIILGNGTRVYYRLNCSGSMDNSKAIVKNEDTGNKLHRKKDDKSSTPMKTTESFEKSYIVNDIESKVLLSSELYGKMKTALKVNDYSSAAEKCRQILGLGIEDMYSVDAVRKLFHCTAMSNNKNSSQQTAFNNATNDSKVRSGKVNKQKDASRDKIKTEQNTLAANSMSDLKSYYESYIQTHVNNHAIINEMFYFIQKCKINLGDYESALNGYKAIIEKNPSSTAGLSAKWEYADLFLLVSSKSNGKGGAEQQMTFSNEQLTDEQNHNRLLQLIEEINEGPKDGPKDGKDKYEKKKFTSEERKTLLNNIVNTLELNDRKHKTKLKALEEKIINNQADANETSEYKKIMLLKELIKIEKVNNINEQIAMIDNDLRRLLALDFSTSIEHQQRLTPEVVFDYKLNQNYPNPFNPSTKINYELKNAGFVSLKIYDLLGREIAELVNETKDAGRYTIDFNAGKYMMSSGIYFYRIKAGEFVDTKRMVLVK
ncbi:MAG: T9SS type A sorting domain-containing protein [Ignavibacteria bacterium]|nr:T9SS type A sorting domain-containing protein [Ignavibacteria bacterium]